MKPAAKRLRTSAPFAAYARASLIAGAAAAPVSAWANFSGSYTLNPPANGVYTNSSTSGTFGTWTSSWNSIGAPTVDTSGAPASLNLSIAAVGGGQFADGILTFLVTAAASGLVSFDYLSTFGVGTGNHVTQYTANGSVFTDVTGSGSISFNVSLGDTFGFRVRSNYHSTAGLLISNFSAPEPQNGNGGGPSNGVPDRSSTLPLLAIGFVGLFAYRAAARRRGLAAA